MVKCCLLNLLLNILNEKTNKKVKHAIGYPIANQLGFYEMRQIMTGIT